MTLTVENARGNDTLVKSAFITVLEPTSPVADFAASPVLGMQPLLVTFSDRSVGSPTSWTWDFGDGSSSTAQNPTHTYKVGRYTVSLTVANVKGNSTATRTDLVYVASGGGSGGGGGGGGGFFSAATSTPTPTTTMNGSSNQTAGNTTTVPTSVVTSWPVTTATTSPPAVATTQLTPVPTGAAESANEFPLIPAIAAIVIVCIAAGAGAYYFLKPGNKPPAQ